MYKWKISNKILVDHHNWYFLTMEKIENGFTVYRYATTEEVGINGFRTLEDAYSRLHSLPDVKNYFVVGYPYEYEDGSESETLKRWKIVDYANNEIDTIGISETVRIVKEKYLIGFNSWYEIVKDNQVIKFDAEEIGFHRYKD